MITGAYISLTTADMLWNTRRLRSWCRMLQESLRLEISPELGGDRRVQHAQVFRQLGRAAGSRDHARHARVIKGKLECRRLQWHAVVQTDLLDRRNLGQHCVGGRSVIEPSALYCPAREDSGIVGAAQDDSDAAPLAQREERIDRFLLQQCVAAGQQKAIEVPRLRELLAGLPLVEAAPDSLDDSLLPQRDQSLVGH